MYASPIVDMMKMISDVLMLVSFNCKFAKPNFAKKKFNIGKKEA